jgi:hypothetical protein
VIEDNRVQQGDDTMKRLWMSGAAAMMAMSIGSLGAQTPQTPPPQTQPQTQQPMQKAATTTIQGCVYNEKDVPGRSPNIAEKAGILEDYILVASAAPGATAGTTGTTPPATAGATGSMAMKAFKLEHADDDKLKTLVGKRVEVTGRVDAEAGDKTAGTAGAPATDRNMGPDQIELPEFEVTSIREVAGTCPATPQIKR